MKTTSAKRLGTLRAGLFASTLAIAAAQAWSQSLIGDGISPWDDPDSRYFHSKVTPPSWQGRPYAIGNDSDRR